MRNERNSFQMADCSRPALASLRNLFCLFYFQPSLEDDMSIKNLFKRMPVACLAIAAVFLLAAPATQAMKLKQQNLTQLISDSQSIIFGTVTRVTDGFNDKGVPYTEVTIAVGSTAKGNIKAESEYTFRQFGLTASRTMKNGQTYLGVTPEGFARWHEGETVAAFMYKPASETGLQTTAGMAQGKFRLVNGALINEFNNAGLFNGVEISGDISDEQRNMLNGTGAVDAGDFMELVGRAVSENWIENGEMK